MENTKFYDLLSTYKLISPIWKYVLEMIEEEIKDDENKDHYLNIFSILFSFMDDGNAYISLDKDILLKKWMDKLNGNKILLSEEESINKEEYSSLEETSINLINNYLDKVIETNLSSLVGEHKMFQIEDGALFVKKTNEARKNISKRIREIFATKHQGKLYFDEKDILVSHFSLTKGQKEAFEKGLDNSLIVTGGPGTGKTTSILFLLLNIIYQNIDETLIYLCAPSGKASNRMKESIIGGFDSIKDEFKNKYPMLIERIASLQESTIHSLLSIDAKTSKFAKNNLNQFEDGSIFIIDEASMIDLFMFSNLLNAIPNTARVYIMGDKDQLPSVDIGAVFGDLLNIPELKDNIVRLEESKRFSSDSEIYKLADTINNNKELYFLDKDWNHYSNFEIKEITKGKYPVYLYKNNIEGVKEKDIIRSLLYKWGSKFYSSLQKEATDVDPNDYIYLDNLYKKSEISKILTAENEGVRGVKKINSFIRANFLDRDLFMDGSNHYPGEIMMINSNNKGLDLYNGDSGILVTFKGDPTLYFMTQKTSKIVEVEGINKDRISKLGKYIFYPLRLIDSKEIDTAYAITIHKSQGSGYSQILVILPNKKGHPLLNRQIVYTAITRTKGNTYILSNNDSLNAAKESALIRDTGIH